MDSPDGVYVMKLGIVMVTASKLPASYFRRFLTPFRSARTVVSSKST